MNKLKNIFDAILATLIFSLYVIICIIIATPTIIEILIFWVGFELISEMIKEFLKKNPK